MNSTQKITLALLISAPLISLGIISSGVQASPLRNVLLSVNLLAWAALVVSYPFAVLKTGIAPGTQPSSRSYRTRDPAGFWTGLVAITMFLIAIFITVCFLSSIAWYRRGA
jgi:hypothetical protein